MADFAALQQAVINGKRDEAVRLTQEALDGGAAARDVLMDALVTAMLEVAERFKRNEYYIPEVLISDRAYKAAKALIDPLLKQGDFTPIATVAIGTVQGDLHDIGKNMVALMLGSAGFKIVDLGTDVSPDKFLEAVSNDGCTVIALSALLTTTMPSIAKTIQALGEAGVRGKVKVIIGGAPVTQAYCDEIGADGYSPDAGSAVDMLKALVA
ncbi:MAG: corrinoid protein [Armatimonadetes bacterium]|nr:corrinoid protein [Armatimonadota bacterium]